jgi:beta-glucanase (GH16 family)
MKLTISHKYKLLLLFLFPLTVYCKKAENAPVSLNLQLTVDVINDGSGLVNLIATANTADRYYFTFGKRDLEEGVRSTDGKASVTYTSSGKYTVKVTAYGPDNSSAVTTKVIDVVVSGNDEGYVTPESYTGMKLAWKDEFTGTSLNTADWTFETGNGLDGWGNAEQQYYKKENTVVDGGYLTITAKKEAYEGFQYTSSRIKTQYNKTFKYGRIDIRAKLPKGQGIWPALWMLGANIETVKWPACGEIDIMELVGGGPGKDNTTYGTIHFDNDGTYANLTKEYTLPKGDLYDKFHVFSLVWEETKITWLVDDVEFHSQEITSASRKEFLEPFFLLFNVAVGGRWPGNPDATTSFPQKMMVDYVRVFQR